MADRSGCDQDRAALAQLRRGLGQMLQGHYPPAITAGCSQELAEVVGLFNRLASQLKELYEYTVPLARGSLQVARPGKTNFLAAGMKELHSKLSHLTWQAQQIETGDYSQRIDFMGEFSLAFNSMISKLEERERRLKEEISSRQKTEEELRLQNRLITDSLQYAAVIQRSVLPDAALFATHAAASFVIWQPRDIVGGDFYWFVPSTDGFMAAVIDCTGHGVPGALMTLAVSQMLKALLGAGVESPAALLTLLDEKIRETFYSSATEAEQLYAGLDMALITVRRSNRQLTFAGARLPLLLLRRGAINELSGCRRSIGYGGSHRRRFRQLAFTDRTIGIEPGDRLFLSSDGFFDQHGSDNPEPFGVDQVAALLAATAGLSLRQQESALLNGFNRYRGEERQRDDITVIGLEL